MGRILRKTLAIELAGIPGVDKELDGSAKGMNATRKTAGTSSKASQIVTQFSVDAFDTESFALIGHGCVDARAVDEAAVGGKQVTVVETRLWSAVHERLEPFLAALVLNSPSQNTTGGAVNQRHEVDFVFFFPTKLYSSSNSIASTRAGSGALLGNCST